MILNFPDVLTSSDHAELLRLSAQATFLDGRTTAGARLGAVKHNEQFTDSRVTTIIERTFAGHELLQGSLLPQTVHSVRIARYGVGMRYGQHIDAAIMRSPEGAHRADLSFTLFLNDPTAYEGGELSLETGSGEVGLKLPARAILCYPTGQLHQVQPVTRGERLVVVGWITSHVADPAHREILWDLSVALSMVHAETGKSRAYDLLVKSRENLLRQWID